MDKYKLWKIKNIFPQSLNRRKLGQEFFGGKEKRKLYCREAIIVLLKFEVSLKVEIDVEIFFFLLFVNIQIDINNKLYNILQNLKNHVDAHRSYIFENHVDA